MKNSITTEEVERLMCVVSEPLRKQWEANCNDGKSLVELRKTWCQAESYVESISMRYQRVRLWWPAYIALFLILFMCVFAWSLWLTSGKAPWLLAVPTSLFVCVSVVVLGVRIGRLLKKLDIAQDILKNGDKVFERFQKSVHALNPHGIGNTYHDVITTEYAYDRLKSLAIRTIDAQVKFDAACKSKFIDRWNITHLGNFIQEAEETFDKTLRVGVEDFSLPFEKREAYKEAQAEYDKRLPAAATH